MAKQIHPTMTQVQLEAYRKWKRDPQTQRSLDLLAKEARPVLTADSERDPNVAAAKFHFSCGLQYALDRLPNLDFVLSEVAKGSQLDADFDAEKLMLEQGYTVEEIAKAKKVIGAANG